MKVVEVVTHYTARQAAWMTETEIGRRFMGEHRTKSSGPYIRCSAAAVMDICYQRQWAIGQNDRWTWFLIEETLSVYRYSVGGAKRGRQKNPQRKMKNEPQLQPQMELNRRWTMSQLLACYSLSDRPSLLLGAEWNLIGRQHEVHSLQNVKPIFYLEVIDFRKENIYCSCCWIHLKRSQTACHIDCVVCPSCTSLPANNWECLCYGGMRRRMPTIPLKTERRSSVTASHHRDWKRFLQRQATDRIAAQTDISSRGDKESTLWPTMRGPIP